MLISVCLKQRRRIVNNNNITKVVENEYDLNNYWIGSQVDTDGDGDVDRTERFVYDGSQIVLRFADDDAAADEADDLANRYLWGQAVDQLLAQEDVAGLQTSDEVLWALTDNLGTVRDLAKYDDGTDTTTVANHITYDAFGNVTSETDDTVEHLHGFTARPFDADSGLQNNWNRWYDAHTGQWLSPDPIEYDKDNTYRYVDNNPINKVDPNGLETRFPMAVWNNSTYEVTIPVQGGRGSDIVVAEKEAEKLFKNFPGSKVAKGTWHHYKFNAAKGTYTMHLVDTVSHRKWHKGAFDEYVQWVTNLVNTGNAKTWERLSTEQLVAVARGLNVKDVRNKVEKRLLSEATEIVVKKLNKTATNILIKKGAEGTIELVTKKSAQKITSVGIVRFVGKIGSRAITPIVVVGVAGYTLAQTGNANAAAIAGAREVIPADLIEGGFKLAVVQGGGMLANATIRPREFANKAYNPFLKNATSQERREYKDSVKRASDFGTLKDAQDVADKRIEKEGGYGAFFLKLFDPKSWTGESD